MTEIALTRHEQARQKNIAEEERRKQERDERKRRIRQAVKDLPNKGLSCLRGLEQEEQHAALTKALKPHKDRVEIILAMEINSLDLLSLKQLKEIAHKLTL